MNRHKDRRKEKRYFNRMHKKLKVGGYVEDCRYHPCLITASNFPTNDWHGADFDCVSLVNGRPNSCSVFHCGPVPLTEQEAKERAAFWNEHGVEAYLRRYIGYTDEEIEEHRKLDAIWHFQ